MDIPNVTQTQGNSGAANTAAARASLDYDAFLKLLVAQMKNQDPTEPMDATQYMAQLASFSNVEQAIQTNNKLDSLLMASALSQADAVLGRTVTSADGNVSGKVESLKLTSEGLVATLENGQELAVGEGIRISGE
jgi:flagellar basal-body rod modification protein FlgD